MCICMCASVNPFSFLYSLYARFDRSTIYRLGQNMGVIILQGHMYVSACVSEITRASEILHAHTHLHTHTRIELHTGTHTHIHANATSTRKFMRTSQNFAVHCSAQYLSWWYNYVVHIALRRVHSNIHTFIHTTSIHCIACIKLGDCKIPTEQNITVHVNTYTAFHYMNAAHLSLSLSLSLVGVSACSHRMKMPPDASWLLAMAWKPWPISALGM